MIRTLMLASTYALLLALSCAPARSADSAKAVATCKARSKAMIDALVKKDYSGSRRHFDTTMRKQFDATRLRTSWTSLTGQVGAYKSRGQSDVHAEKGYTVVSTQLTFAKGPVNAAVACDGKGAIAGLRFVPVNAVD